MAQDQGAKGTIAPYTPGSVRKKFIKELNTMMDNRDYRKKRGIDDEPFKGLKDSYLGWMILELNEELLSRVDATVRTKNDIVVRGINDINRYLDQMWKGIKDSEHRTKTNILKSTDLLKAGLQKDQQMIRKVLSNLEAAKKALGGQGEAIRAEWKKSTIMIKNKFDEYLEALNVLGNEAAGIKDRLISESNQLKTGISNAVTSIVGSIGDEVGDIKSQLETEVAGLQTNIASSITEIEHSMANIDENLKTTLSEELSSIKSEVDDLQHSIGSILDDKKTAIVSEMQQVAGGLSRQSAEQTKMISDSIENIVDKMDAFGGQMSKQQEAIDATLAKQRSEVRAEVQQAAGLLGKMSVDNTAKLSSKSDDLGSKLEDIIKILDGIARNFNDGLEQMNKKVLEYITELEENNRKYFQQEVAGLRDLLSGIRSDIEMQKHVMLQAVGAK